MTHKSVTEIPVLALSIAHNRHDHYHGTNLDAYIQDS